MKKVISMFMAFAFCLSFSISATATYQPNDNYIVEVADLVASLDIEEEIEHALSGVIDNDVSQNVLDNISIVSDDKDSEVLYTVTCLGEVSSGDNIGGNVYTLTAVSTKNTSKNKTEDNVYCWITLTWIDNLGVNNELVSVSGGWTANGRTLSNRQVLYGVVGADGSFLNGKSEIKNPTTNSYYYTPSKSLVGLSLRAYSWVDSAGYDHSILCEVLPTIFD